MANHPMIHRFYPLENLNFRDFWDICSHLQRVAREFHLVTYSIEGEREFLAEEESDVAVILRRLSTSHEQIRRMTARFYRDQSAVGRDYGNSKLVYLPSLADFQEAGLYFYSDTSTKLTLYKFEDILYSNYEMVIKREPEIEFGVPCEVLAAVIDMRGFSVFCEQPNIESPYTCGLMTAFYHTVRSSFVRYPPEMMKFLGDGVLSVWETAAEDRQIAIDVCLEGIRSLNQKWTEVRKGPHFTHGAPKDLGTGMSFGLASKISVGDDYIGRPINLASRLCAVCPAGTAYLDKSVPSVSSEPNIKDTKVRIKSFGEFPVWALFVG